MTVEDGDLEVCCFIPRAQDVKQRSLRLRFLNDVRLEVTRYSLQLIRLESDRSIREKQCIGNKTGAGCQYRRLAGETTERFHDFMFIDRVKTF